MEFNNILNQLMEDGSVSAYKLHQILDVSNSTIKNWLDGKSIPSGKVLAQISKYFDCTTDYLLGLSDNPKEILDISDDEREFLEVYIKAKNSDKEAVQDMLKIIDKMLDSKE